MAGRLDRRGAIRAIRSEIGGRGRALGGPGPVALAEAGSRPGVQPGRGPGLGPGPRAVVEGPPAAPSGGRDTQAGPGSADPSGRSSCAGRSGSGAIRVVARADDLLVDDILTSGATCGAAARALKRAGASKVVVVVVARAEGKP